MSMISGLIDELNKSADEWNASNMFELARMCRDAADTIWQLRDDLQRANAENAKLRSELESVGTASYLYGRSDLKAENAKLREERDNYKALWEHATVTDCELRRVRAAWKEDREQNAKLRELCKAWREFAYEIFDECFGEPELNEDFMTLDDRMEALGIEVD